MTTTTISRRRPERIMPNRNGVATFKQLLGNVRKFWVWAVADYFSERKFISVFHSTNKSGVSQAYLS